MMIQEVLQVTPTALMLALLVATILTGAIPLAGDGVALAPQ